MKLASIATVVEALNRAQIRYLVAGGIAVIAHGYTRLTKDLDLVIAFDRENLLRALATLGELGYRPKVPVTAEAFADPENRRRWKAEKGMLVFQLVSDLHRTAPIDVFSEMPFDFDREWARVHWAELAPKIAAPVVDLEALLAMKRAAGRDRDLIDIRELTRRPETS